MRSTSLRRLFLAVVTALVLAAPAGAALSWSDAGRVVAPAAVCDDMSCH